MHLNVYKIARIRAQIVYTVHLKGDSIEQPLLNINVCFIFQNK